MATKWHSTKFPGVRYRKHKSRKHGAKLDRYYAIRYQKDGKRVEEGLGWSTQGWTAQDASIELASLVKAAKTGRGPSRLSERREIKKAQEEQEAAEKQQRKKDALTFSQYFEKKYFPVAKTSKKKSTYEKEEQHFRLWISPVIGEMPIREIKPSDIEQIKTNLLDDEKSLRTVQHVMSTIRIVWNHAKNNGIVVSESPTKKVTVEKFNNMRCRFLSPEEAGVLLEKLKSRDQATHDMALVSLHTGARASEIFNLKWIDVKIDKGIINLKNTKNSKPRVIYMTKPLKDMFIRRQNEQPNEYVFKDKNGEKFEAITYDFRKAVKDCNFNNGLEDRRDRVCFHTLRHNV